MLTERGVDGVAVSDVVSLRAVVDRHKNEEGHIRGARSGRDSERSRHIELEAFAELYESLTPLTIDTLDMHGLFVGDRALVDGRMAFEAEAARRRGCS